jgi:hypothetical protein
VHYIYITSDELRVEGQKGQGQGRSFWKDHCKLMFGSIPEVVHTITFDRTLKDDHRMCKGCTVTLRENANHQ